MSPLGVVENRDGRRFPRVSGDEPLAGEVRELAARFSPRERG